jgi:uncharacterized protein (DUF2062 family)
MGLMIVELAAIEATVISLDKLKQQFKKILSLDAHPGHISAGFAVGVFISFTPFFGLHTLLAIALAFIFRLNKLTCITGSWVNTPLTVVPILVASYNLGRVLRGKPVRDLTFTNLDWHSIQPYAKSILLGSSIIGFMAAVVAYFICYWLVTFFRRKDATLKEMTREMEEVGEELE